MGSGEEKEEGFVKRIRPHIEMRGIEMLIAFIVPAGAIAYLDHAKSIWEQPALWGFCAGALGLVALAAIKGIRRLPPKRIQPDSQNIESCVRGWLDSHHFGIKTDSSPETYFRLRITLDSGKMMTVLRMRDQSKDYIQIIADLSVRGDDKKLLEQFSHEEIEQIFWDTRVELARAQVAYGGLEQPLENFFITRRLPIQHNLTEYIFVATVGSIEAAMNLVGLMYIKTKTEAEKRIKQASSQAKPPLAFDIPKPGLPEASSGYRETNKG